MSELKCIPISPVFGARLSGIDTSRPASAEEAKKVQSALGEFKLVIIPGGLLSASQLASFGKSLGLGKTETFGAQKLVSSVLSGFEHEPEVLQLEYGPDKPPADINLWHQDHTWRKVVTRYELSYADVMPSVGGNVLYADATKAYNTLSPRFQEMLEGTTALNVLANGYQNLEFGSDKYAQALVDRPPITQPVVACDPDTQERWLNVNKAYSCRINELSRTESDAILPMLFHHIREPEHCVRIRYDVGDVVIFDNHRLQHYAVSDYFPAHRRILRMSYDARPIRGLVEEHATKLDTSTVAEEKKEEPSESSSPATTSNPAHTKVGQQVAELATELTAGLRLLQQGEQADLCAGFFSARIDKDFFLAPSHGTHWNEATPSTFGVYKGTTRVAGEGRLPNFPSTAVPAAIYKAFPEIKAIVHAHPRSMMALAALGDDLGKVLPISEPSFMFYERVAFLPCNFFFDEDYIAQMIQALESGAFCLIMRNHSYTMVGRSIQECYLRCYMLEQSASIQLQTLSATGGKLPPIPDSEECLFHRRSYEGYNGCPPYDGSLEWPGLIRGLDREHPGWSGDQGWKLARSFENAAAEEESIDTFTSTVFS